MAYIPLRRIRNASKNVGVVHSILIDSSVITVFGPPSRLRRLRRTPSFARPAIRSHGRQAVRRMVEVRGVEPLSETALTENLRVYPAIGLGRGTPTGGLIPFHPLGSAPCSRRTEPPAACPARLCRGGSAGVGRATCGHYLGRESVIAVRNYLFSRFLTRPTRILDARSDLNSSRRNRITPIWLVRVLYPKFRCRGRREQSPTPSLCGSSAR